MTNQPTVLRIDTSVRKTDSVTRTLTDKFIASLTEAAPGTQVVTRDLASGLPLIDEAWTGANFTDPDARTEDQKQTLAQSDSLIEELKASDILVIGVPIYNFGAPAGFKTWVDLIARARVTFRYTENGPEGLVKGKKAYIIVASGGTKVEGPIDFATPYVKQALAFVGIDDVTVIAADQMMMDAAALEAAHQQIDAATEALTSERAAA